MVSLLWKLEKGLQSLFSAMANFSVSVEGPDDTYAWDSRIRKLAACCRHSNTAPVSFYGLRKVSEHYTTDFRVHLH